MVLNMFFRPFIKSLYTVFVMVDSSVALEMAMTIYYLAHDFDSDSALHCIGSH